MPQGRPASSTAKARTPVVPASMAITAPLMAAVNLFAEDLGADGAHAAVAEGLGGAVAEVEDPTLDVRAAVVHQEQDLAAVLRHEEDGAERQLLARARPPLLVVDRPAGRRPAVEAGPVPGCRAAEDLARRVEAGRDAGDGPEGDAGHELALLDRRHLVADPGRRVVLEGVDDGAGRRVLCGRGRLTGLGGGAHGGVEGVLVGDGRLQLGSLRVELALGPPGCAAGIVGGDGGTGGGCA